MPCLSDDTIHRLVRGELTDDDVARADQHVAGCPDCRGVVADALDVFASGVGTTATLGGSARNASVAVPGRSGPLSPGQRVGRYVIQNVVGAGGMGMAYAAQDPALNRRIILKVLRKGRDDSEGQAHLVREAQAMAQLSHPNVVSVYDVGTFEGQVFIAMELVAGVTLRHWLRERRPWQEVLKVFLDAGRGLTAAHAVGIVHRDFKPENVLVSDDQRVRVMDFGLARPAGPGDGHISTPSTTDFSAWGEAISLTQTGIIKGTPAYMAPEQFSGDLIDPRTDQFAFCVALYEALYGRRPFQGRGPAALMKEVLAGHVAPIPSTTDVPAPLSSLTLRGLRTSRDERFESMNELLRVMETVSTPGPSKARSILRPRNIAAVIGAIAVLLIGGTVLYDAPTPRPVVIAAPPSLPAPEPAPLAAVVAEPSAPVPAPPSRVAKTPRPKVKTGVAEANPRAPLEPYDDAPIAPSFLKKAR